MTLFIRVLSKSRHDRHYSLSVCGSGSFVFCTCGGFRPGGGFCSHVDAVLVARERAMVVAEDWSAADQAVTLLAGRLTIPPDWKAVWRENWGWRGMASGGGAPAAPEVPTDDTPKRWSPFRAVAQLGQDIRTEWAAVQAERSGVSPRVTTASSRTSSRNAASPAHVASEVDAIRRIGAKRKVALPRDGDSGSSNSFTYVDRFGVVTERTVVDWTCEGQHLEGHCLKAGDHRTFRIDRIENWRT